MCHSKTFPKHIISFFFSINNSIFLHYFHLNLEISFTLHKNMVLFCIKCLSCFHSNHNLTDIVSSKAYKKYVNAKESLFLVVCCCFINKTCITRVDIFMKYCLRRIRHSRKHETLLGQLFLSSFFDRFPLHHNYSVSSKVEEQWEKSLNKMMYF